MSSGARLSLTVNSLRFANNCAKLSAYEQGISPQPMRSINPVVTLPETAVIAGFLFLERTIMTEKITFNAVVYKVQTLADNGIRITLDLPETAIPEMAMLAETKRQGIALVFEASADKSLDVGSEEV